MKNKNIKKAVVLAIVAVFFAVIFTPSISSISEITNVESSEGISDKYEPFSDYRGWYWKPPYPNYAPHTPGGMPDFDQKQDQWKTIEPGPNGVIDSVLAGDDIYNAVENRIAPGPNCHLESDPVGDDIVVWAFCGPVAVANCFWWFDSKYADPTGIPGDGEDEFPLVEDYGAGDDHAAANVPLLIEQLANAMQTSSKGTTYIDDMQDAIDEWFVDTGLDYFFEENTYDKPSFDFIEAEIERSQDVILLLGWYDYFEGEKVVDQAQFTWIFWDNIQPFTLWDYQGFVPSVTRLDAIKILIVGGPGPIGINVYDSNFNILGTSIFDPGVLIEPAWIQFHFEPFIPLTSDNLYYFDVWLVEEGNYEWFFEIPDVYPPGPAFMDGNPFDIYYQEPFDWTFQTEYYDPLPGCYRTGSHYVTCAGVNSGELMIAFSDPFFDIQNASGSDHNDAQYVSHDVYDVLIGTPSPELDYLWWLPDYPAEHDFTIVEQAVIICPKPLVPDLDCDGELSWTDIEPGATVEGSFTVSNIGDPGSLLDWEIESYPEWGTWTFDPDSGEDLTPEDGPQTVQVEVVAPDEPETEFTGEIKIINSNDPSDYYIIQASLITPVSQHSINSQLFQFLQNLMQRFPMMEQILKSSPLFSRILNQK